MSGSEIIGNDIKKENNSLLCDAYYLSTSIFFRSV